MKKLFISLSVVAVALSCFTAKAENPVLEKIALYPANLVLDALDVFTVNVGAGPVADISLQATAAFWGGGNVGMSGKLYKAYNRQYGAGIEQGWYWELVAVGQEDRSVIDGTALVNKYTENRDGVPDFRSRVYDLETGARDYWACGGSLGLLVIADLYLHPVEIADFITGIFLYDLKGDDICFDDFR